MKKNELLWVDEFINRIKPYVYMRLRDNVLIRMPNEAFKLNNTGARVISHILNGGSVQDFIVARANSDETQTQLERFFLISRVCGIMKCAKTIRLQQYTRQNSA